MYFLNKNSLSFVNQRLNTHSQTIYGSLVETHGPYYQNYTGRIYEVFIVDCFPKGNLVKTKGLDAL